jgi:hypothetical protein
MDIYNLDKNFPQESIDKIAETKAIDVEKAYAKLQDSVTFEKIRHETREMIPQIDERIHYWEERRTIFLQISLGILAAALAGIVAIGSDASVITTNFYSLTTLIYIPILILSLCLIYGCINILLIWNKQNNPPYPFTKATRTWRWHYRHSETSETKTDFESFDKNIMEEEAYKFANNLADYKIKTLSSSNNELLDQDISQLYLLLINEKFKIKFVTILRNSLFQLLKCSFITTGISLGLLVVIFLINILSLPK